MRKLIAGLLLIVIYASLAAQNNGELYFQPAYALGATASKTFDEVSYIPLQTTKKSIFGRIRQLIVTDKYFIIWDADTNSIYFFARDGKFLKKYKPKKYTINAIQLNKIKNAIFISGINKNYSLSQIEIDNIMEHPLDKENDKYSLSAYYQLDNIYKENVELLKNFGLAIVKPVGFDINLWAYSHIYANRKWDDVTDYELSVYNGKKNIAQYFPYNKKTTKVFYKPEQVSFYRNNNNNELLCTRPYNYNIYQLNADSITLLYKLVLPLEMTLPKSFFELSFNTKNDFNAYRSKNGGYVWDINNVIDTKNYLFFSLDYNKSSREKNFMFDKANSVFYNASKINPDSSNAYLPLLQNGIQYFDENYLYSNASSVNMFQIKENTKNRQPKYDKTMQDYFDNSKKTSNPVIIQLKLKNKIG